MCRVRDAMGMSAKGALLNALAMVGVMSVVIFAGNAGMMLWTRGTIDGLWAESATDLGYALVLTAPILPFVGRGNARRLRC